MKPDHSGENMWLRAQTANKKFKQNAQKQHNDDRQAFFCVIDDAV